MLRRLAICELSLQNDNVEEYYTTKVIKTNDCRVRTIGVEQGFSKVSTDSDGDHHGTTLGVVLSQESGRLKRRNKLKALTKKKPWIKKHNLERKKLDKQTTIHQTIVKLSFIMQSMPWWAKPASLSPKT